MCRFPSFRAGGLCGVFAVFSLFALMLSGVPLRAEPAPAEPADEAAIEEGSLSGNAGLSGGSVLSDAINMGGGPDGAYSFDGIDDEGASAGYQEVFQELYVRPGFANGSETFVPFRAARRLARGIRVNSEAGMGYDSDTLLDGREDPNGWVSWFRLGVGFSGGHALAGGRFIYGFDVGGSLFAYESGYQEAGRDNVEPYFVPYVGFVGGKTTMRLSGRYRRNGGNSHIDQGIDREAPRVESQDWGGTFSLSREMDHGSVNGILDYRRVDFRPETSLNDEKSVIGDLSWMYNPAATPKTSFGIGGRTGAYDFDRNPDSYFLEPSFRLSYRATAKTTLDGRVGYAFRWYDDENTIPDDGRWTYALGSNWLATERIRLRVEAFRDFRPSYVSYGESYDSDGVRLHANYAMPWWRLHLGAYAAYERASYYSTVEGVSASREDDFMEYGVDLGRPINLISWIETSISLFYRYSENSSNETVSDFDRHFGGVRITGNL